jgi:hypothetical protein
VVVLGEDAGQVEGVGFCFGSERGVRWWVGYVRW